MYGQSTTHTETQTYTGSIALLRPFTWELSTLSKLDAQQSLTVAHPAIPTPPVNYC